MALGGEELTNDTKEAGGSRPVPDPTVLTTEQILREIKNMREWVAAQLDIRDERLGGIDKATDLRLETFHEFPGRIDEKVGRLEGLSEEKFASIQTQFKERDTRQERESRDNKVAVDAAFAAQKEAASEQNKSNTLAIDKSERATQETINKLAELFRTTTDGLGGQIGDLKDRVGANETETRTSLAAIAGQKQGGIDSRVITAWGLAAVVSIIAILVGIATALGV